MFEALKSLYITGFSASWRKAKPLAAPSAIFILVDHGRETEYPAVDESFILIPSLMVRKFQKQESKD